MKRVAVTTTRTLSCTGAEERRIQPKMKKAGASATTAIDVACVCVWRLVSRILSDSVDAKAGPLKQTIHLSTHPYALHAQSIGHCVRTMPQKMVTGKKMSAGMTSMRERRPDTARPAAASR